MIVKSSQIILISTFILVITSCKESILKPDVDISDYHRYYPTEIGYTKEYQVSQIVIDAPSNSYDTVNYFLKETFSDYFVDNTNDSSLKIERFYRMSNNELWQSKDVWYANLKKDELQVVEENIRYVKLKNPITLGKSWDGNKYNHTDTLNFFKYTIINISDQSINEEFFDSVVTIQQRYDTSLIDKILFLEKYAKNVGLVYKEITIINSQGGDINVNIPIEDRITTGFLFKETLISHYNELY